jgi:hypothetical protein
MSGDLSGDKEKSRAEGPAGITRDRRKQARKLLIGTQRFHKGNSTLDLLLAKPNSPCLRLFLRVLLRLLLRLLLRFSPLFSVRSPFISVRVSVLRFLLRFSPFGLRFSPFCGRP